MKEYIVADTETTGLDVNKDRLVSISMILVKDEKNVEIRNQYLNPVVDICPEASKVNGLSREILASHPTFETKAKAIKDFVGDKKIVFHNAPFDMGMIKKEYERTGISCWNDNQVIDSLQLARDVFNSKKVYTKFNLDELCKWYKVKDYRAIEGHHSSLADTKMLASMFKRLWRDKESLIKKGMFWTRDSLIETLKSKETFLTGRTVEGERVSSLFIIDKEYEANQKPWYNKITVCDVKAGKVSDIWLNTVEWKNV